MIQYEENTIGWWLSQLKEPLRGEMFGRLRRGETTHNCDTLSNALFYATSPSSFDSHYRLSYLLGIVMFYDGDARQELDHRANGWDMAKECAPDNWLKPKDGGEDKAIVDSPAPEIPVTGAMIEDFSKRVKWPITREIEAPERAVVGYEEPKPIDTIEKKHELRIKNLEAYNKYQAERNQQIMDLNPHVDFCDSEGNLVRPSRMTALEARVKELEDQLFKLLGSKNG